MLTLMMPLAAMLIGGLVYYLTRGTSPPTRKDRIAELGRLLYQAGALIAVYVLAERALKLILQ